MLIIKGVHTYSKQEYFWKLTKYMIRKGVKPGDRLLVKTRFGNKPITVTEVRELKEGEPEPTEYAFAFFKKDLPKYQEIK